MIKKVLKYILDNGLTLLVLPSRIIPKVSVQLWYNVGSKDELSGQKGIAHLIEHMIFKGTATLSECDINLITHKLSGYCNAFTSYDYTGYLFDFPTQNWHEALPIMADCMQNCTFKQEFLNSELKAVIQELKMYRDNYIISLTEYLITAIFNDHPYHHPIIGYKQDLWSLKRDNLIEFYKYHYIPNNSTLVVVGDVDPENVFSLVKKNFENIKPNWNYKKSKFYHSPDLRNYQVKIYRDIKEPVVILTWIVPGASKKEDYLTNIVSWILGSGRGSRLYKKLIDKFELVTELETFSYDLFEYGLFNLYFKPKKISDVEKIIELINEELADILSNGVLESEIIRAIKKTEVDYLSILESNQNQAYEIGKYFLATSDEHYFANYTNYPKENLNNKIQNFVSEYLLPEVTNRGYLLGIKERDRDYWLKLQDISDQEDARVLSKITRTAEIEEGKCVYSIEINPPVPFDYPKAKISYIPNNLKLLHYNNSSLPKIDLILDFKAKYFYDPVDLQGLSNFTAAMLEEGTKNYSAIDFADTLESYGMALEAESGYITLSMLSIDLAKGLELINEMVTQGAFDQQAIDRVRAKLLSDLNEFWDQPKKFVNQLVKEEIYKDHPYSKNKLGTTDSINKITRDNLLSYYQNYLSPNGSRIAIVGSLDQYDVKDCVNHMLGAWQGPEVKDIDWPEIKEVSYKEINYPIMRDQTVLCYAGLSVSRTDPDYDKLLIFDQIFTGGVLGSMSSKLFDLREKTGLFYTINGSLVYDVKLQPGLVIIKTIVSNDRLSEAEKAIEHTINTAVDNITKSEFDEAKNAIINTLVDNFSSNYRIAATSLSKDYYNFAQDYFDKRAEQLSAVTIENIQETVKNYLDLNKIIKVRVGRV